MSKVYDNIVGLNKTDVKNLKKVLEYTLHNELNSFLEHMFDNFEDCPNDIDDKIEEVINKPKHLEIARQHIYFIAWELQNSLEGKL